MSCHLHIATIVVTAGASLIGALTANSFFALNANILAASLDLQQETALGDADRGRNIYQKIGGCCFCHGYDGDLKKRPPLSPKLAEEIARLNPPPANLRNPASLKSDDDEQRFLSIKFGHPGTAMFSKRFLRDEEIRDLLAYLANLRGESPATRALRP
jgi:cytochrome c553